MTNKLFKKTMAILAISTIMFTGGVSFADTPSDSITEQAQTTMPTRQPTSKRQLAMKFVMAMLGVGASSVVIFVTLSLYNRVMYGTIKRSDKESSEDNDFKTSTNMKEALDIFLKKTK